MGFNKNFAIGAVYMWGELAEKHHEPGVIEYGIFQRKRKQGAPIWRRHKGAANFRFKSIRNALFAPKGARSACLGAASYPQSQYSSGDELLVPYVAVWREEASFAYLIRASAGDPEITIVPSDEMENLDFDSEAQLSKLLAAKFSDGAEAYGIRYLGERRIGHQ